MQPYPRTTTLTVVVEALSAVTVTVPALGTIPAVQLELAIAPGVTVSVQEAAAAKVPLQVDEEMTEPAGSPDGTTEALTAEMVPAFELLICRDLPVRAASKPRLSTDSAREATLEERAACPKVA